MLLKLRDYSFIDDTDIWYNFCLIDYLLESFSVYWLFYWLLVSVNLMWLINMAKFWLILQDGVISYNYIVQFYVDTTMLMFEIRIWGE
jgi:hypothetical protein